LFKLQKLLRCSRDLAQKWPLTTSTTLHFIGVLRWRANSSDEQDRVGRLTRIDRAVRLRMIRSHQWLDNSARLGKKFVSSFKALKRRGTATWWSRLWWAHGQWPAVEESPPDAG